MNKFLIASMSDMHGFLPEITNKSDIICICGDIFPQEIERKIEESKDWFHKVFIPWIISIPGDMVIMIPGNHCFYFESEFKKYGRIIMPDDIQNKCFCLVDESINYHNLHFYGTPWVTNLPRWAFNTDDPESKFENIPYDCNILLTHHAPDYGKLGCSYPNTDKERNFGSAELTRAIKTRPNIKYHFCGHIHTGTHGGVKIGNTSSYNVSILDEQYQMAYPITYIKLLTS